MTDLAVAENIKEQGAADLDSSASIKVLVVEDDLALQEAVVDTLELAGIEIVAVGSAEQALDTLAKQSFSLVVSDVNMPGMDGHQLLAEIRRQFTVPVLLMTAYASIERSVQAIRAGASDYIVKPFKPKLLLSLVNKYASANQATDEQVIAEDPASQSLLQLASRVAATDSTVLLSGESGVGKEVIARYIHRQSSRSKGPFIAINCAAIPETMLEATLFGHEKGAYTGAHQSMPGKFELANGGTLLLDEVSEMDLGLQAKLLRVIQEREVERVGGKKTIALDVRIVATTNRELRTYVEQGNFREDLFYRLSVFPLSIQPLRERSQDIIPLAEKLLSDHAAKMGRAGMEISSAALNKLASYAWPGNIRELDNVIQRALILQPGTRIQSDDISVEGAHLSSSSSSSNEIGYATPAIDLEGESAISQDTVPGKDFSLDGGVKNREYQLILEALEKTGGSKKDASQLLDISPRTLRYKMAKMRELGLAV